jgi:hypothetical protein
MNFSLEFEQEIDGRWIAEIPELPGVLAFWPMAKPAYRLARRQKPWLCGFLPIELRTPSDL